MNSNKLTNINNSKTSTNFIERNIQQISIKSTHKHSNSLSSINNSNKLNIQFHHNNSDSDVIIKCLNDIVTETPVTDKPDFKINQLIKNIDVNNDQVNDISVISSHSSIRSSTSNVDNKITKINENEEKENLIFPNEKNQRIECEIEPVAVAISVSNKDDNVKSPSTNDTFYSKTSLVQGNQKENIIIDIDDYITYKNNIEDDVNIFKSENEISKVRSDFIQRFGDILPKRRQVIPNLVEIHESNSLNSLDKINSNNLTQPQYSTTDYLSESASSAWQYHQFIGNNLINNKTNQNQENLSLMATINAVSQPLVKMHNDLENKISNVLKELEHLRKNDLKLSKQLEIKKKLQESNENLSKSDESLDEFVELKQKNSKNSHIDTRIQYLEKLQENQVIRTIHLCIIYLY